MAAETPDPIILSGYTLTINLNVKSEAAGLLHSFDIDTTSIPITGSTGGGDEELPPDEGGGEMFMMSSGGGGEVGTGPAITGETTSRLEDVRTYSNTEPFKVGVNGVTIITSTYISYVIDEIVYTTYLADDRTVFAIGTTGLNEDNSVNMELVKRESDAFIGKIPTVDKIEIDRNEMSVFQTMYRFANIDTIDDLNNYF